VAVAVAQTQELARRGHDVHLFSGWDGVAQIAVPGVKVHLFRTSPLRPLGFSGLIAPRLMRVMKAELRNFDMVHIHLGRHFIPLAVARLAVRENVPFVVQTHGMVMPDFRLKSRMLDFLATREVLRRSARMLALTPVEMTGLTLISGDDQRVALIRNGIEARTAPDSRSADAVPEVLFLARLHPRKRVLAFAEMALLLNRRGIKARFTVIGPDEGDLARLKLFIAQTGIANLSYMGSISPDAAAERLRSAAVYVLPSSGEVFPMTVLEAISVGTPVVITSDCGIAEELLSQNAALVTDGSPSELAGAVEQILLKVTCRDSLIEGMKRSLRSSFGIAPVAASLERIYAAARIEI
jgi:glycosyltransferase involved in cell wall biosynthesis